MKADFNPLDYELDNDLYEITRLASDEFFEIENEIFFYGKIVDSDEWITGTNTDLRIHEDRLYSVCPNCGELFELDRKYGSGSSIECPACGRDGVLFDYRDKDVQLEEYWVQRYAWLDTVDTGYVLRLFDVSLDASDREYDNYETLDWEPTLAIVEVAREYWCAGELYYYTNDTPGPYIDPTFRRVDTVDDGEYWIVNYDEECSEIGTSLIADILHFDGKHSNAKNYMEYATRGLSYKAYATIKRYDLDNLLVSAIYFPCSFPDSAKISEVLGVDYNQVAAQYKLDNGEFGIKDLQSARELKRFGIALTKQNVEIMQELDDRAEEVLTQETARKTFKYLRNLCARKKSTTPARDYADYLKDCERLGYDLKKSEIRYPSNLKAAHAKTTLLIEIENSRETEDAVRDAWERYHAMCEWSDGKYQVIIPKCCDEIVKEGVELNHCVGKYCERVAKGEDIILFVRRAGEPNKAFYTLEIRPTMRKLGVVQCRGYKNEDKSAADKAAVDAFIARYSEWFHRRPVIDVPETMTRRYYKAVRKTEDGRFFSGWDGKTEYKVGEIVTATLHEDPDRVAAPGIHLASLAFAQNYGDHWTDVAILEIEVNLNDVVVPDAKDQIRASRGRVIREVPMVEMGTWGARHSQKTAECVA